MRKIKILLFISFAMITNVTFAQSVFSPSFYYTYGDYSNLSSSKDASVYASFKLASKGDYFIAGFDKLKINNMLFDFDQKMIVAGIIKNVYPFYLKFNYAHINGDFTSNAISATPLFSYTDKTNLINAGLLYNFDLYFVGFTYTYLKLEGIKSINSHQVQGDFIWEVSPKFIFSIKPLYTRVTDGRNLISANVKLEFPISPKVKFSADGSLGERAYYFNPDLLTIYNQDETQRTTISGRFEFSPVTKLKFILSYQHAKFNAFNINYFIGGVKLLF